MKGGRVIVQESRTMSWGYYAARVRPDGVVAWEARNSHADAILRDAQQQAAIYECELINRLPEAVS